MDGSLVSGSGIVRGQRVRTARVTEEEAAKMGVITAKMGVIRGIRHLTTFGHGKIAVCPMPITHATPLATQYYWCLYTAKNMPFLYTNSIILYDPDRSKFGWLLL